MYIGDAEAEDLWDLRFIENYDKYNEYYEEIMNSDLSILRVYNSMYKSNYNKKINIKPRANNNFYCDCIFHNAEDLPLRILESKKAFACYACGISGTIVSLLSLYYGITLQEAIKLLHAYICGETEKLSKRELIILKEIIQYYNSPDIDELFEESKRKTEYLNNRIERYINENNSKRSDAEKISKRLCCSKKYVKKFIPENKKTKENDIMDMWRFFNE